jgi:FKBP-type peptidyl-prolyl cis-trans isomerase
MLKKSAILALSIFCLPLVASSSNAPGDTKAIETAKNTDVDYTIKVSKAIGHMIAKNLNEMGVEFDLEAVMQGMKDSKMGVDAPMSDQDCMTAITNEQKKKFDQIAEKNLSEAENFLSQEAKKPEMISLDEGKVLYQVLKEGTGNVVSESSKVSFQYKGSLLNGEIFGESNKAETMEINHLVSGLKNAMIGMKEGEKRLILIHPDKGYGKDGMLPPNSLLQFEIEIEKANVQDAVAEIDQSPSTNLEEESAIR